MSSRVDNLRLLVEHINHTPNDDVHRDPNLKFTILYGGSTCEAPAKIIEHVPESFFSLKMSPAHLLSLGGAFPLRDKVDLIFKRKLGIFAEILQFAAKVKVHETLLHHILPFLWADEVPMGLLQEAVTNVGWSVCKSVERNNRNRRLEKLEGDNLRLSEENEALKNEVRELKEALESKSKTGDGGERKRVKRKRRT